MSTRRPVALLALAAAALTALAACSSPAAESDEPERSTSQSESEPAPDRSSRPAKPNQSAAQSEPEPAPVSSSPQNPDEIYFDADSLGLPSVLPENFNVEWRGGMIAGGKNFVDSEAGTVTLWGWIPGMDQLNACELDLWEQGEHYRNPGHGYPNGVDLMATTSDSPEAAVVYSTIIDASGLKAEETHVFFQALDIATCDLGERIDVRSGELDWSSGSLPFGFIAASENSLTVVNGMLSAADVAAGVPDLVAIEPGSGNIAWQHAFGEIAGFEQAFGEAAVSLGGWPGGVIAANTGDHIEGGKRLVLDAADGSTIAEVEDELAGMWFREPTGRLGTDRVVFTSGRSGGGLDDNSTRVVKGSGGAATVVAGGELDRYTSLFAADGEGGWVVVGRYCPPGTQEDYGCIVAGDSAGLGYVGAEDTIVELLPPAQAASLGLDVIGVSNGRIYIKTTAEQLVLGLDGKQIGSAYDPAEYPYIPVGDQYHGKDVWTLWIPPENWQVAEAEGYVLTRSGIQPKAASLLFPNSEEAED